MRCRSFRAFISCDYLTRSTSKILLLADCPLCPTQDRRPPPAGRIHPVIRDSSFSLTLPAGELGLARFGCPRSEWWRVTSTAPGPGWRTCGVHGSAPPRGSDGRSWRARPRDSRRSPRPSRGWACPTRHGPCTRASPTWAHASWAASVCWSTPSMPVGPDAPGQLQCRSRGGARDGRRDPAPSRHPGRTRGTPTRSAWAPSRRGRSDTWSTPCAASSLCHESGTRRSSCYHGGAAPVRSPLARAREAPGEGCSSEPRSSIPGCRSTPPSTLRTRVASTYHSKGVDRGCASLVASSPRPSRACGHGRTGWTTRAGGTQGCTHGGDGPAGLSPGEERGAVNRADAAAFDLAIGQCTTRVASHHSRRCRAQRRTLWNFLSLVGHAGPLGPAVPGNASRWESGTMRNPLRSAWVRRDTLGDLTDRYDRPLGVDEMVGLFERSDIARNRPLIRALAKAVMEYDGQGSRSDLGAGGIEERATRLAPAH